MIVAAVAAEQGGVLYGGCAVDDRRECLCDSADDTVYLEVYDLQSAAVLHGGIFGAEGWRFSIYGKE